MQQRRLFFIFSLCILVSSSFKSLQLLRPPSSKNNDIVNCGSLQDKLQYNWEEFVIQIFMKKQGSQQYVIFRLQNSKTLDVYEATVDHQYINDNVKLFQFYGNPCQFYSALIKQKPEISINSKVQILVTLNIQRSTKVLKLIPKKKLEKTDLILNKMKEIYEENEIMKHKIASLQFQQKKLLQNDQKIKQMFEKNQKINNKIASLQRILTLVIQNDENIKITLDQIKNQLEAQRMAMKKTKEECKEAIDLKNIFQNKVNLLKIEKDAQFMQLHRQIQKISEKSNKQFDQKQTKIMEIESSQTAEFLQLRRIQNQNFFITKNIDRNVLLKYKGSKVQRGFLKLPHLQVGKITKLSVKQIKTQNKEILYGIATNKTIGMNWPHSDYDSKHYFAHGFIYQNGTGRAGESKIVDGNTVTIIVDLINWRVIWEINNKNIAETEIQQGMRESRFYFSITMFRQNDEVEIIDY